MRIVVFIVIASVSLAWPTCSEAGWLRRHCCGIFRRGGPVLYSEPCITYLPCPCLDAPSCSPFQWPESYPLHYPSLGFRYPTCRYTIGAQEQYDYGPDYFYCVCNRLVSNRRGGKRL